MSLTQGRNSRGDCDKTEHVFDGPFSTASSSKHPVNCFRLQLIIHSKSFNNIYPSSLSAPKDDWSRIGLIMRAAAVAEDVT